MKLRNKVSAFLTRMISGSDQSMDGGLTTQPKKTRAAINQPRGPVTNHFNVVILQLLFLDLEHFLERLECAVEVAAFVEHAHGHVVQDISRVHVGLPAGPHHLHDVALQLGGGRALRPLEVHDVRQLVQVLGGLRVAATLQFFDDSQRL